MEARPYNLQNLRRAAEERRKAASALTEAARRTHLELARIFEARAGIFPAEPDSSNVIPLLPKAAAGRPPRPAKRTARSRSTGAAAPRAG